ncbi:unnamed protein product [Ectocarpus sp. 12 AP-2014]
MCVTADRASGSRNASDFAPLHFPIFAGHRFVHALTVVVACCPYPVRRSASYALYPDLRLFSPAQLFHTSLLQHLFSLGPPGFVSRGALPFATHAALPVEAVFDAATGRCREHPRTIGDDRRWML